MSAALRAEAEGSHIFLQPPDGNTDLANATRFCCGHATERSEGA
jgi:hypothetical protein